MKESHPHIDRRRRAGFDQTLAPHRRAVITALRNRVGLRTHDTKIPTLLVFHGRRSIRIKNVALVKHRIRDPLDKTHDGKLPSIATSSSTGAVDTGMRLSIACSHVGIAWSIL